jgi:hypothetical protein
MRPLTGTPKVSDNILVSLSNLPVTPQQRGTVFAIAAGLLAAFGITAPFAGAQLPPLVSFNPAVESMVFVNDLVTSILLFSQYAVSYFTCHFDARHWLSLYGTDRHPTYDFFSGRVCRPSYRRSPDKRVVVLLL